MACETPGRGSRRMVCPHCAAENAAAALVCARCGRALQQACPVCGTLNPVVARFCMQCGTALGPEPSSLALAVVPAAEPHGELAVNARSQAPGASGDAFLSGGQLTPSDAPTAARCRVEPHDLAAPAAHAACSADGATSPRS